MRIAITELSRRTLAHGGLLLGVLSAGLSGLCGMRRLYRRTRARNRRERALERAVLERTDELERERLSERARSGILEDLLANQPLVSVLESIARYVSDQVPACRVAVLLQESRRWHIAAAPGIDPEWAANLIQPRILPSEAVLREGCCEPLESSPEWAPFLSSLKGVRPRAIHSRVIAGADATLGALVAFEVADGLVSEHLQAALQAAVQLAYIAVEHRRYYDDLRHRANHDALTDLANRTLFSERLADAVQEAASANQQIAVLSLDLDHFKRINDTLGPRGADIVLTEIAARILRVTRPHDTAARTGGDEFMLILGALGTPGTGRTAGPPPEVELLSQRLLEAIRQPMLVDGQAVTVTASLGSSVFPCDAEDPEGLRRRADAALLCARKLGRNRAQPFTAGVDGLDRIRIEEELCYALDHDRLKLHYQPKMGADGSFCGLEALVRLTTPQSGAIAANALIPVAEETGLILRLGAWVLSEACRQMREWHASGLGWVAVAVNVSPLQISRPGFAREVRGCLQSYGVPPHSLELELTESVVLGGGEEGEKQMRDLRAIGVRFSIDDFGTGYSSLSYLYQLPVDAIKLDRSFVRAIGTDEGARRLVQAMLGVAEGLGLDVVAEGVETEEQKRILVAAGCRVMQGYLFARPAPPSEVERFFPRLISGYLKLAPCVNDVPPPTGDLLRMADAVAVRVDAPRAALSN